jgi:hypothetical protein
MRFRCLTLVFIGCAIAAFALLKNSEADEPTPPPQAEPSKGHIVPVVVLTPGETKELHLSTSCALITRGRGLLIREMKGGVSQKESKVWKRDGITVEVPDFSEAVAAANASSYAPLKEAGLWAFIVKVSAADEAKLGLSNLHIADETCSGTCDTDFRVLVVAPSSD